MDILRCMLWSEKSENVKEDGGNHEKNHILAKTQNADQRKEVWAVLSDLQVLQGVQWRRHQLTMNTQKFMKISTKED